MTTTELQQLADGIKRRWRLESWTIRVFEMEPKDRTDKGGTEYCGRTHFWGDSETADVYINPEYDDQAQVHTVYHEMAHIRLEGHGCQTFYERGLDILAGECIRGR